MMFRRLFATGGVVAVVCGMVVVMSQFSLWNWVCLELGAHICAPLGPGGRGSGGATGGI